ncbi:hypothetical protein PV326_013813 [Microctonus aethiopoides]|uniref:Heparanase n=1 Tax=Microctonus aethiopoides TaxID=144406 RepID=A0AA39KKN6_9HYME|nr:hypothetical protein PV326_013813 [Microctonus aethiopoides]KAK0165010.1 hypothetical protein PV328_003568 [Microctonus aethiopoides]
MSYFDNTVWNRNQYHNIEGKERSNTAIRSLINFIVTGLILSVLLISIWQLSHYHSPSKTHTIVLNVAAPLIHKISKRFLSFGLDSSLLRDMKHFPVRDNRFINLARHLSPAYVRVGGTSADCLFFNRTLPIIFEKLINPVDGSDINNFTLSTDDYLAIYEFTNKAGIRMMFDLNVLIRRSDGKWDDTNAREIINFSKGRDMMIDWQMGNEPNSFRHVFNRTVSAKQLADDYNHLRMLLNNLGYMSSILVGPEVNHIGDENRMGELYAVEFLKNDKNSISYVTWHQYYLNGREATTKDFVNPEVFNRLPTQIDRVKNAIKEAGQNITMWMSETSSAYGGGAPELSDKFVAGFLWLDKLGYSASTGVNVVIRQSLFGGYYAMVGPDLNPNPDWWVSVMFKQFVSEKVLQLINPNKFGTLRLYAHCTAENALINRVPSITIYGVNIDSESARISLRGNYDYKSSKVLLYILTADYLKSREIRLNGDILALNPDGSLPPFKPIIIDPAYIIVLPPFSMAFIILHGANAQACAA